MKRVSIITVNYNQPQVTEDLLASILEKNTYPDLEVIVVDNGSRVDHTPAWIQQYPAFRFLRSDENLGFSGGNNLGIGASTGDYLFLINNDTVITPRLIETLVHFLEQHPDCALVSPRIRYYTPDTMLQYAGFTRMNFYTARNKCIGQYETDQGQYDQAGPYTHYAHGAAMMLRKEVVVQVGLMPENYFLYYEEMDWCEMFKRAGYRIGLCMEALIYHRESVSTGKNSSLKAYYMTRNRMLFVRRNANAFQQGLFFLYYITVAHAGYWVACLKNKQPAQIPLFTKAVLWNMTNSKYRSDRGSFRG